MRLDVYCSAHLSSRTKAKDLIRNGCVSVNGKIITKPGFSVKENDIVVIEKEDPYVSRAAYKLLGAFDAFDFSIEKETVLDIGASTGGFTQVCLEKGADHVYALDVGHSQLDPQIARDPRVTVMEKTNARQLKTRWFDRSIDFVCMDVSFISCKTILDPIFHQLRAHHILILIKPQFEVGPQYINKNGIVTDPKRVHTILEEIKTYTQTVYQTVSIRPAMIEGRGGNREYTMYACQRREEND